MATKYFCDGCDEEIGGERARFDKRTRQTIVINWGPARGEVSYDLCAYCATKLDPQKWARVKPEGVDR